MIVAPKLLVKGPRLVMPVVTELDIVITPPERLVIVWVAALLIPLVLPPEFPIVIIPELLMIPPMLIPKEPEFVTAIFPPEFMVMMPKLRRAVPLGFDIFSVVPDGITSSSVTAIELPLVVIVHVLVGIFHVPYVGQEVASSVMVVACASWGAKVNNAKINTAKMERYNECVFLNRGIILFHEFNFTPSSHRIYTLTVGTYKSMIFSHLEITIRNDEVMKNHLVLCNFFIF